MWLFSEELWGRVRGKVGVQWAEKVSADTVREAGSHINYAAASAGTAAPPGSFAVIISPEQDVHRAALAVADDRVYLLPPEVISDIASRLTGAWDSIRIQTHTLGPAEEALVITQTLHARRALLVSGCPASPCAAWRTGEGSPDEQANGIDQRPRTSPSRAGRRIPAGPTGRGQHRDDKIPGVHLQFLTEEVGELLGVKVASGPFGKRVAAPERADGRQGLRGSEVPGTAFTLPDVLHRACPQFQHLDGFHQACPELGVADVEDGHLDDPQELAAAILPGVHGRLPIGVEFACILPGPKASFPVPVRFVSEVKQAAQGFDRAAGRVDRPCVPLRIEIGSAGHAAELPGAPGKSPCHVPASPR